jgi:hypothetical protein
MIKKIVIFDKSLKWKKAKTLTLCFYKSESVDWNQVLRILHPPFHSRLNCINFKNFELN